MADSPARRHMQRVLAAAAASTIGNRGDKQDAAGHVTPEMTDRYDHELPVVDTPKPR